MRIAARCVASVLLVCLVTVFAVPVSAAGLNRSPQTPEDSVRAVLNGEAPATNAAPVPHVRPTFIQQAILRAIVLSFSWMLRSSGWLVSILKWFQTNWGARIANTVQTYSITISNVLFDLAQWSEIPVDAIRLQVTGALLRHSISRSTAEQVGLAVKELIMEVYQFTVRNGG